MKPNRNNVTFLFCVSAAVPFLKFLFFNLAGPPMLDINLFREEKGGNPEVVRDSQRRRFKPVERVDEVIAADQYWRQCERWGGVD